MQTDSSDSGSTRAIPVSLLSDFEIELFNRSVDIGMGI